MKPAIVSPVGSRRRTARNLLLQAACLSALWCCAQARAEAAPSSDSAAIKLYARACDHVARGHFDLAFASLRESLGYGHTHPMQVVSDSCFARLVADPAWRAALRGLLRRHAWEDSTVMVAQTEPGERIRLLARVTDALTGEPIARAAVGLVQADSVGSCQDVDGTWNPRLFAYLLTDDSGGIQVETIRPGATGSGETVTAHVQFTVSSDGYATLDGRILLSDQPGPSGDLQEESVRPLCVARRLGGSTHPPYFQVDIGLLRKR